MFSQVYNTSFSMQSLRTENWSPFKWWMRVPNNTKFELNRKHRLDTSILLIIWLCRLCNVYFFCTPVKSINIKFTKIDEICGTLSYNIHTKFELNRMHHLDATVCTRKRPPHTHACTHTCIHYRKIE